MIESKDENILRMTKNLKNINTIRVEDLNIIDILNKQNVILSKGVIKKLEETFSK